MATISSRLSTRWRDNALDITLHSMRTYEEHGCTRTQTWWTVDLACRFGVFGTLQSMLFDIGVYIPGEEAYDHKELEPTAGASRLLDALINATQAQRDGLAEFCSCIKSTPGTGKACDMVIRYIEQWAKIISADETVA